MRAFLLRLLTALAGRPAFTEVIVRWDQVREGDLVLIDDGLVEAVRVSVVQKPWGDGRTFTAVDVRYHRLDNGQLVESERHADRLTAVRRPNPGFEDRIAT